MHRPWCRDLWLRIKRLALTFEHRIESALDCNPARIADIVV